MAVENIKAKFISSENLQNGCKNGKSKKNKTKIPQKMFVFALKLILNVFFQNLTPSVIHIWIGLLLTDFTEST